MAPLAGRPPFATDEPDSFYESPPQSTQRFRQPPPPDPNKRTSAYDVYDTYLTADKQGSQPSPQQNNRTSGIGNLLMNMGDDSDSDEDDDDFVPRKPAPPPAYPSQPQSKHAALAAATAANPPSKPSPSPPSSKSVKFETPRQNNPFNDPAASLPPYQPPLQPIAAPRPGYAAPIATLNLARPEPSMPSPVRGAAPPNPLNPFNPPMPKPQFASSAVPGSPAPSTPHPLLPPVTPITPAFVRPTNEKDAQVKFEETKPIMRGNAEDVSLLPQRGEKGDEFWKRFSMVAKIENDKPESSWLKETRSGTNRYSRWVWCVSIALLIGIGVLIGLGVFLTRNNPDNQQPTVLGDDTPKFSIISTPVAEPTKAGVVKGSGTTSRMPVTPTYTIDGRGEPTPSAAPLRPRAYGTRSHARRRPNTY